MNCWLPLGEFNSAAIACTRTQYHLNQLYIYIYIYMLLHLLMMVLNFVVASSWFINQLPAANS